MRLVLGNWPPLLSHLLMVVFGMGIHSIFTPTGKSAFPMLRANKVLISVPKRMQIYSKVERKKNLGFVIKENGKKCKFFLKGTRLHHAYKKTLVISLALNGAMRIIRHLRNKSLEGIFVENEPMASRMRGCFIKPVVRYGLR